ncbi:hypothetical protein ACFPH6_51060 [Streptomyces xiangluensis]|uniref:Transposase of IS4/5 family n=1 Tax=Streptomyces xiangluensis TaxID=2665720 RepID=A0ABV8Z8R1_9ACTN
MPETLSAAFGESNWVFPAWSGLSTPTAPGPHHPIDRLIAIMVTSREFDRASRRAIAPRRRD